MSKKSQLSTELFKNKNIPAFIREHSLFKQPVEVKKIFPSIGLPNFVDNVQIEKTLADLTKENSYVFNVIGAMNQIALAGHEQANVYADRLQYLETKTNRDAQRDKIAKLYEFANILQAIAMCTDPYQGGVIQGTICLTNEKKCVLKLINDIADSSGKLIFKKGDVLFSVFHRLKTDATNLGVAMTNLEQTDAFKVFSKENIPNKGFQIVFSSDGEEGAWDIATMSMRGIKSCQRWDGEYPRCLIGSILSKFVGIIYLTSGAQSENHPSFPNLGTKMIRRCVVRYAVNVDEKSPAIIIDKMYPEPDKMISAMFVESLQKRTKLPVYHAQELGNKLRSFYLPTEKIRDQISTREWSYQDNPLKSKHEFNTYTLFNSRESIDQEVSGFSVKLQLFLTRKMEDDLTSPGVAPEIRKTLSNLKINSGIGSVSKLFAPHIVRFFRAPNPRSFTNGKTYYRKYLFEFLTKRKTIFANAKPDLVSVVKTHVSNDFDESGFVNYLSKITAEFVKVEARNLN